MKYLMKNFKSLLPFLLMVFALVGCDTDDLRNDVDELKNRVESLEAQVTAINENMNVLQVLVEGNKTIKSCVYDEATKTYKLVLSDDTQLELYQGEDGMANTPEITISDDNKWVINGTPTGVDATGADAALPKFKLDDQNYWMVDLDGDGTVYDYDYVYNEAGDKVQAIADAANVGGDTFFESVNYNEAEGFLEVKLASTGTTYNLPVVPELTCKINTENVEEYKDGVLTVGYGLSAELEVEVQGDNYFVTAPSGWTAVLGEVDLDTHKATLTVYAPKEEAAVGTLSRATADNSTDLSLQVYKGGYWAVAKIQVQGLTIIQSYKSVYDEGETIMVGDMAINKATYGDAKYVNTSDYDFTGGGVFFIAPGVEVNYKGTGSYETLILIGDDSREKSTFNLGAQIKLNQKNNGALVCYNLSIQPISTFNSTYIAQNGDNAFENAMFYDCYIKLPSNQTISYISPNNRSYENFFMVNCLIEAPNDTKGILSMSESTATYSNVVFKNNIIYNNSGNGVALQKIFHLYDGKSTTLTKVEVSHNTFINISTSTTDYVYAATISEVISEYNLIYFDRNLPGDCAMFRPLTTKPTGSLCDNNIYYKLDDGKKWTMFYSGSIAFTGVVEAVACDADPFDGTLDIEKHQFTPSAAYADYGAKLD